MSIYFSCSCIDLKSKNLHNYKCRERIVLQKTSSRQNTDAVALSRGVPACYIHAVAPSRGVFRMLHLVFTMIDAKCPIT